MARSVQPFALAHVCERHYPVYQTKPHARQEGLVSGKTSGGRDPSGGVEGEAGPFKPGGEDKGVP